MADLVYDEVRKIVEALEVNPNLEQFFTRTREGKIEIKWSRSSDGESRKLIPSRSQVQVLPRLQSYLK